MRQVKASIPCLVELAHSWNPKDGERKGVGIMHDNKELWYRQPARYWEEALPLGNGRLGAMLFSGVEEDVLMINEDTLWSGYPKDTIVQDAYVHYQKARDLALEKRYEEAEREIEENLTGEFTDSYLPLGKVCMRFPAFAPGSAGYL